MPRYRCPVCMFNGLIEVHPGPESPGNDSERVLNYLRKKGPRVKSALCRGVRNTTLPMSAIIDRMEKEGIVIVKRIESGGRPSELVEISPMHCETLKQPVDLT